MFENELVNFKDSEHFMEIVPVGLWENFYRARYNRNQLNQIGSALPLKIVRNHGVNVDKDFDIKITDMAADRNNVKPKHFHGTGDGGLTFKVEVVIQPGHTWGYGLTGQSEFVYMGVKYPARARIPVWLNYWYVNMTPLYVVTDAIDVPNGKYIISNNPSRKQTYDTLSIWNLELTTYNPLDLKVFEASPYLTKYTGKTAKQTAKNSNLATCDINNFVYCKEKTATTQCTRWLQEKLYQIGLLPKLLTTGWYNDEVTEAVAQFQKKYKNYFNLKVTGKIDQATLNAICSM